jgi:putative hemolysin
LYLSKEIEMDHIDIALIIKSSNSKFLKKLPDFVIGWISNIIKQDEINEILDKYSAFKGIDFVGKIVEEFEIKAEFVGFENLPENGKCFFIANHPFGLLDGLVLTFIVGSKYGRLKAIGNDAFMYVPNLKPLVSEVNVFGKNKKKHLIELNKVFSSDVPITHFPFGMVSRVSKFRIQDEFWHKSFIAKSIEHERDIVPIRIYGKNSNLFYTIYIFRKLFRVKLNIELILLPRELFRKKGESVHVKIGKVIHHNDFDKSLTHWEWAQKIRSEVYSMKY